VPEVLEANPLEAKTSARRRLVYGEDRRVGQWGEARGSGKWREGSKCIGLERAGELIAAALYDWHNGASVYTHIAIEAGQQIDRDFLWHIFYYPFVQLGCNVLIGLVAEDNYASRRFVEHLGFTLQTNIPNAHPSGALRVYVMRREACRWLQLREAA
jgi:hypothetical protein